MTVDVSMGLNLTGGAGFIQKGKKPGYLITDKRGTVVYRQKLKCPGVLEQERQILKRISHSIKIVPVPSRVLIILLAVHL